jgi:hypothetical protein
VGWTAEDVLEDCGAERGKKVFIAIGLRLRKFYLVLQLCRNKQRQG